MRRIPGPKPGLIREYIPNVTIDDWSNILDPEPVIVSIRTPTAGQQRSIITSNKQTQVVELGENGDPKSIVVREDKDSHHRKIIETFVVAVKNYEGPEGEPITNGKELWEHGDSPVVYDVITEILKASCLTDEDKKKSVGSLGCTPQTTQQSVGIAQSAEQKALIESETVPVTIRDSGT